MLLAFVLAFAACLAFGLAMDRHLRQVWPRRGHSRRSAAVCCGGGTLLLAAAAFTSIQWQGMATGLVSFCALVTLAVMLLALFFSYRPAWLAAMPLMIPPLVLLETCRLLF